VHFQLAAVDEENAVVGIHNPLIYPELARSSRAAFSIGKWFGHTLHSITANSGAIVGAINSRHKTYERRISAWTAHSAHRTALPRLSGGSVHANSRSLARSHTAHPDEAV